jgi:hypothetical protein
MNRFLISKRLALIVLLTVMSLLVAACAGDAGARGPAGPQGPAGSGGAGNGSAISLSLNSVTAGTDVSVWLTAFEAGESSHGDHYRAGRLGNDAVRNRDRSRNGNRDDRHRRPGVRSPHRQGRRRRQRHGHDGTEHQVA